MATATPTVELFVRSLTPQGTDQESILERLDRMQAAGQIDDYSVTVWGDRIALDSTFAETAAGRQLLDRIDEFEQWATTEGVSLDGCFETKQVDSMVLDSSTRERCLPVRVMAEYENGELRSVTPHVDGDETRTVSDRLDELADQIQSLGSSPQVAPSVD